MRILAASAIAICGLSVVALAHDIPNDVVVQAFLKPDGDRLRLLVRVPLQAMRDVDIPKRGPGYLDLTRAETALRNAATLWLTQEIQLYEEDTRLGTPRLESVRVSLPSDQSFREYEQALAHVTGAPLEPATELYLGTGDARCPHRVPDRIGVVALLDSARAAKAWTSGNHWPSASDA